MIAVFLASSLPSWLLAVPLLVLPLVGVLATPAESRRKLITGIGVAAPAAVVLARPMIVIIDQCKDPNLPYVLWLLWGCYLAG